MKAWRWRRRPHPGPLPPRRGERGQEGRRLAALALVLAVLLGCGSPLGEQQVAAPEHTPPRPEGHLRMVAEIAEIAAAARETNVYVGEATARGLRGDLAALPESTPAARRLELTRQLAEAELKLGEEARAIELYAEAVALAESGEAGGAPGRLAELRFRLALARWRRAETENCRHHGGAESCILPLRAETIHRQQESTREALSGFLEVLAATPPGSRLSLASLWLANLAAMALGEYPQGVPPAVRLPPAVLESEARFPRFANVAPRLGLATVSLAGGAVADDFDGDADLDLAVTTAEPGGQMRLFRNRGDGTFEERTAAAGLIGITGGLNLVQADYDGDGDVDLLVLRGAWNFHDGRHPNSLLDNDGRGRFTDVTFDAGLGEVHYPTQTGAWADYDRDGDLDLYIGNESFEGVFFPGQLFENHGDGTFTDVAAKAGVENDGFAKSVAWGDYDDDGWPDLFVSNYRGWNRLYRNGGDGTFTDVAGELGLREPVDSFPAWFWDFDNDGVLDLFVAGYGATIGHLAASHLGLPVEPALLPHLFRGDGAGGFEEVGRRLGFHRPAAPMGSNFGDLDHDGDLDVYLGTGWPNYEEVMPNVLYQNQGGERFADVTIESGLGHLQKGHAIVFADFDHDGDQDVFQQLGGFYPGDAFADALYENPGFGNRWLAIELSGTASNRSAIGARLRLAFEDRGERRTVYRHVNTGGSFGGNPLRQTIGLGRAEAVAELEVRWPATGETQRFTGVPADRLLRLVEGEESYTLVELRPQRLGRD